MRRLVLVPAVFAAFFSVSLPTGGDVAEARTLFERLFPKTAERRRKRRANEVLKVRAARKARAQAAREKVQRQKRQSAERSATRNAERRQARQAARAAVMESQANRYLVYQADVVTRVRTLGFSRKLVAQAEERAEAERRSREVASLDRIGRVALRQTGERRPFDLLLAAPHVVLAKLTSDTPIAKAMRAHYLDDPRFLWLDEAGRANGRAKAVLAVFAAAGDEALDPTHYAVPDAPLDAIELTGIDVADGETWRPRLEFEFAMTLRALRYLRDARHGRVVPSRISTYHDFSRNKPDEPALLAEIVGADDPAVLLAAAHPPLQAYKRLRAELLAERNGGVARPEPVQVPVQTFLKPTWKSEHMSEIVRGIRLKGSDALREKHAVTLKEYDGGPAYSKPLAALVRDFQREQGLGADGIIGPNTLQRIVDGPKVDRTRALTLAMERLRWHPDGFGPRHVFINAPEYRARYMVDGDERLAMRVVVGKPGNQTNFFHDEIEYVEFNPYWGVPASIKTGEFLPKLRKDPSYLDRNNYELRNARGKVVPSTSVNWWNVDPRFPFDVRQRPGPRNALGRLKIMFPNRHDIYMHDTPHRKLFARTARAFSHGCVRLHDPQAMAAAVLGTTLEKVEARIASGKNNAMKLKTKVPVYVAYFTAWPKADGTVGYHADVYNRDTHLERALGIAADERLAAEEA